MIHRNKRKDDPFYGYWNGIGGKFEEDETPVECLKREVLEETGLTLVNPIFRGILTSESKVLNKESWYVFVFTCAKFFCKPLKTNPEGDLKWIASNKIETLNLQEADRIFLKLMKEKRLFSAKFKYENHKLVSYHID